MVRSSAAKAAGVRGTGHVTPRGLLRSCRRLPERKPVESERLREKWAVRGCCGSNLRLLLGEPVVSKGSTRESASRRAHARSLRCGGRQGLRSLRDGQRAPALDCHPRSGCFAAMRKMSFSHVPHDQRQRGDPRDSGQQRRPDPAAKHAAPGAVAGFRGASGEVLEPRHQYDAGHRLCISDEEAGRF
jgi:hypothetical protein